MRATIPFLAVAGLTAIVVGRTFNARPAAEAMDVRQAELADGLVVHEWGTFTSITGSDGVRLEFRPLVDNDLPEFVVNRAWQGGRFPNLFSKWDIRSLQRMETPVTYFYTDREREVDVKVGFPKGLLTEFYPPVQSMKPEFDFKQRAEVGNSELNWGRITLIPVERLAPQLTSPEIAAAAQQRIAKTLAPDSHSHPHYVYARETDSAFIHVRHKPDDDRPAAPVGDHFEKFLFYRGVGNFPLPVTVVASGNEAYEISNTGAEPLRSLFLVTNANRSVYVQHVKAINGGETIAIQQNKDGTQYRVLEDLVAEALVAEGLYEKEAQAMVKTWRDSWFEEEGTRLFYILPQSLTDELLPLTIAPAPEQVVRVMVGRLEILSPEEEQRITAIIQESAVAREAAAQAAADPTQRPLAEANRQRQSSLPAAFVQMGRLAEPALIRAKSFANDSEIRVEAGLLLDELHRYQADLAK